MYLLSYSFAQTFLGNCWSLKILWSRGKLAVQSVLYYESTHFLHVTGYLI